MSRKIRIEVASVFKPLTVPSRYKGAHGGRGSGKSHFFSERIIHDSLTAPGETGAGLRSVCIREVQKSLASSSKQLIEDKLSKHRITERDGFKVFRDVIQTPGDGIITFHGMRDSTAENIKSMEDYRRAWVEEAQTLSSRSLALLRPTIRAEGSELWFSWNPRRKSDTVDEMFRSGHLPTGATVVQANWSDNPWLPPELEQERKDCLRDTPDQYDHIWEGGYATVLSGAYFRQVLTNAKKEGRIGVVAPDPLLPIRTFHDIGGAGARADAYSIWAAQFVGQQVRVLNYYESQGQTLAYHVNWMRENGYENAEVILPHDGVNASNLTGKRYEEHWEEAGFSVDVVPNQGTGAASQRIEAARRLFPSIWFNESTCAPGIEALGWYHERLDENRNIGLGPEHDWSSHCADAFGLMCVFHEVPVVVPEKRYVNHTQNSWMAG